MNNTEVCCCEEERTEIIRYYFPGTSKKEASAAAHREWLRLKNLGEICNDCPKLQDSSRRNRND